MRMARIARLAEQKAQAPKEPSAKSKAAPNPSSSPTNTAAVKSKPKFLTKAEREAAALARLQQRKQGGSSGIMAAAPASMSDFDHGGRPRRDLAHDRDKQRREREREYVQAHEWNGGWSYRAHSTHEGAGAGWGYCAHASWPRPYP